MAQYDFIVIGSGIAGLLSAIHASKKGSVMVVTKKKLAEGSTPYAQGGIAVAVGPKDSFKKHIADTLETGHFLNDRKAVEFIVKRGPAAVLELESFGVRFNCMADGRPDLKLEGGHSENRIVYFKDEIGREIENALIKRLKQIKNITIFENTFVKDLILKETSLENTSPKKQQTCIGVEIIKKNKVSHIFGRRTILATGGAGQVFLKTTNPEVSTGDGIAMANRAGCRISGMEFFQFHPTALDSNTNPLFLLSETLRGEGARLLNEKGVRFMAKVHPLAELAPRDIISRTMVKQHRCYLDLRGITPKTLKAKYPNILAKIKASGKNPEKDPIPVSPVAHYLCGGIRTDLKGRTGVKNLYAAGECANTGLHGSNRLASNSLLEAAVMAKQVTLDPLPRIKTGLAGTSEAAKKTAPPPTNNFPRKIPAKTLHLFRKEIQTFMWQNAGIIRSEKSLKKALSKLESIEKNLAAFSNPAIRRPLPTNQILELHNLLETALLIVKAALKRKKSIGTHYRTD